MRTAFRVVRGEPLLTAQSSGAAATGSAIALPDAEARLDGLVETRKRSGNREEGQRPLTRSGSGSQPAGSGAADDRRSQWPAGELRRRAGFHSKNRDSCAGTRGEIGACSLFPGILAHSKISFHDSCVGTQVESSLFAVSG